MTVAEPLASHKSSSPHAAGWAGVQLSGTVCYIGDGDNLCVGASTDPREWVEVRLADFDAPELQSLEGMRAREALSQIALNRSATCITERGRSGRTVVFDRVITRCRVNGASIGDLLRRAGIQEGGR